MEYKDYKRMDRRIETYLPLSSFERKDLLVNGVYKIINIRNNKIYIGSCSSKGGLYERIKHHQQDLINNKHCNFYLQKSFDKYRIDSFYFTIIENCSKEDCIAREQYWLDKLKPDYNLEKIAGSSLGRECKDNTREKIKNSNKNWWLVPENRDKMISSFSKRKKRINFDGCGKGKRVIDINTGIVYNSLIEYSKVSKYSYSYLCHIIKDNNMNIRYE